MTTVQELTNQTERARKSAHQATVDQAALRKLLVTLDRQPDGPGRNELARLAADALSRRLVLGTLQAADLLLALKDLIPKGPDSAHRTSGHEDGLDLMRGHWHAQATTAGRVRLGLVPDVVGGDGLDTPQLRRQVARRMVAILEEAGFEILVKKSEGKNAEDALVEWGNVYLTK